MTPSNAVVIVGQTLQVVAATKDATGAILTGRPVTWASSDSSIATVSATGLVTAVALGNVAVSATCEGKSARVMMLVRSVPVASVTVAPAAATLTVGLTQQLTAVTLDSIGGTLVGRTVTWTSSDASKATVTSNGLVTAMDAGTVTITATSETKTGAATITVVRIPVASITISPAAATLLVGSTQQLTATTRDASGNVLPGRSVSWSSSDGTKATVLASGLVTAIAPGSATITATSEGKLATITVTVQPIPVANVTVSPATAIVLVGTTQQLTATMRGADGTMLSGRPVVWSSSDETRATVSSSGLVTAVAAGAVTIWGTSEGKSAAATLTLTTVACAPTQELANGVSVAGSLQMSPCAVTDPFFRHAFTGPEPGGSYYYNLYTVSVYAGSVARVVLTRVTLPFSAQLIAFDDAGAVLATGDVGGGALVISNNASATRQYRVMVTTLDARATGTYTIRATMVSAVSCTPTQTLAGGQTINGNIRFSQCSVLDTDFSSRSFTGPESGGLYFYELYTLDVPANTVAQLVPTRAGLSSSTMLLAFDPSGTLKARADLGASLTLANNSTSAKSYQVLVTTYAAGATGQYSLSTTMTAIGGSCAPTQALASGQAFNGTLRQSSCAVTDTYFSGRRFSGPESGGTYFYDLYTVDVAPSTVARLTTARGTLPPYAILIAFDQDGALVARGSLDAALTLNNSSATTKHYQVLLTTYNQAATGTYSITASPTAAAACTPTQTLTASQPIQGAIRLSQCAVTDAGFYSRAFTGPENAGTYFYELYTFDLAANNVAQIVATRGTLAPAYTALVVFDPSGKFVARASTDGTLTLSNNTSAPKHYQVLVTTSATGATGTYTISATTSPLTACAPTQVLASGQSISGTIALSPCAVADTYFSSRGFSGPESGGQYFYNLYTMDVAANASARLVASPGTLTTPVLLVFAQDGAFVARTSSSAGLTVTNGAAATRSYQVLVTTVYTSATGTYSIGRDAP